MDTKWNSMDKPSVVESVPLKTAKPKGGGRIKATVGFLAFFLGVSLTVSSLGGMADNLVWERSPVPLRAEDWQETEAFRDEVSSDLRDLLTIGAGGRLDIYNGTYWDEDIYYGDAIVQEQEAIRSWWGFGESATTGPATMDRGWGAASSSSSPAESEPEKETAPDAAYQNDKNVLYFIETAEKKTYTNTEEGLSFFQEAERLRHASSVDGSQVSQAQKDYNFFLTFQNGKVSMVKDGLDLDVYGNGFYDGDARWFVPGYENFPAGEQLEGVTVHMAVRETPIRYYGLNYRSGGVNSYSSMYYIFQQVEENRAFFQKQLALLACGLGCLLLCFALRRAVEPAKRKIASWTVHIWTEARVLIGLILLFTLLFEAQWLPEFYYCLRDCWYAGWSGFGMTLLQAVTANVPALLGLFWLTWLIHNDHRYNPKEARRSLLRPFFRGLRARELKRSLEKRISRQASLFALAAVLLCAECLTLIILLTVVFNTGSSFTVLLWSIGSLPLLLLTLSALALAKRQLDLARDLGRVADKVEAIRGGDLTKPLAVPADTDLWKTVESLNDIQAGMKAALAEQTRSERMKVELVSNVSHDLKTPLTSILSYAELLRQEELPPAAADYARIIDEKSRRLKTMVEDVFEISKAAADQLPVHLERLDFAKLLRQTLADMDASIRKSSLTFKIELPEEPVMITADGKRLYRVFQNLIDNTLRYALEGSRVYLSLKISGKMAEASVRNTSRSELPEGVDFTARFVRGDASRSDGGSGLGLSIASSFTEACGGSFRVETVADLFTAVVTFPLS